MNSGRRWRVGRSLGRTLYLMVGEEPSKDDMFVGVMDTIGLAGQVVAAINGRADLRAKVEALPDSQHYEWRCISRADVLALIDGADQ